MLNWLTTIPPDSHCFQYEKVVSLSRTPLAAAYLQGEQKNLVFKFNMHNFSFPQFIGQCRVGRHPYT